MVDLLLIYRTITFKNYNGDKMSYMRIVGFISNYIFEIKRKRWIKKLRAQLVNKEFTLISNNCCAGIIYSDLGLQLICIFCRRIICFLLKT